MFRFSSPVTLQLTRGEVIAWPSQSEATVKVVDGLVWITHRHDLGDHWLHAGQAMSLPRGARAVIGAERGAVVLRFEAHAGWRWTLARWARRLRRLVPKVRHPAATVAG